jgi:hypothetical protein
MKREEAIALLTEMASLQLIQPVSVQLEQHKPDKYMIKIKNGFNTEQIEAYIRNKKLQLQHDREKEYLLIFEPEV